MQLINKRVHILILSSIFLTLFFTTVSAQTPPSEAECRICHETTTTIHHDKTDTIIPTPTEAPYGTPGDLFECESCHAVQSTCGGDSYIIETDCLVCHVNTDPHHTPATITCRSCHEVDRPPEPHQQSLECWYCHFDPGGLWYDHTPTPSTCNECHEDDRPVDPHPQTSDCAECHLDIGNSWLGAIYDHSPTPSTCNACHEDTRPADPHPQTRDCAECHLDIGNSWLGAIYDHSPPPSTCNACHEDTRPADPHLQTRDCAECHLDIGNSWLGAIYDHTPTPSTCNDCHEDTRPAEPHPQTRDCAECHLNAGNSWLGATYDHTPVPSVCAFCHEDERPVDPHPQGQECNVCHSDPGGSWLGAIYDHSPTPSTCNACHENDRPADPHPQGPDCTFCHSDPGGSWVGATCDACHNTPQDNGDGVPVGGRRAAVAEFPTGSAGLHAHYGATLDPDSCKVCHSVDTHLDGYVELIDPDNASIIYRFIKPSDLTSDPDISNFCSGCHDDDGAQRLAVPQDPFGNGNVPPDVATRFKGTLQWDEWQGDFCFGTEGTLRQVNSHHDISDSDQAWSGAKIECLNCHGAHNASADTPVADPSNQTQPWTGTMNEFCLSCHYGGNSPLEPGFPVSTIGSDVVGPVISMRGLEADNCSSYNKAPWWVDYTWSYTPHGKDSKRGWPGYSGAPSYELNCTDCHDQHGSYTETNTLGNPYMIRDFVDGTAYIDDGNRPQANYVPGTTGIAGDVVVTVNGTEVDWGSSGSLCTKCHATWLASYSWHSSCNGCMTCHGHGQSWDGSDWGPEPNDSTRCYDLGYGAASATGGEGGLIPVSGSGHESIDEQNCSACHVTTHR